MFIQPKTKKGEETKIKCRVSPETWRQCHHCLLNESLAGFLKRQQSQQLSEKYLFCTKERILNNKAAVLKQVNTVFLYGSSFLTLNVSTAL